MKLTVCYWWQYTGLVGYDSRCVYESTLSCCFVRCWFLITYLLNFVWMRGLLVWISCGFAICWVLLLIVLVFVCVLVIVADFYLLGLGWLFIIEQWFDLCCSLWCIVILGARCLTDCAWFGLVCALLLVAALATLCGYCCLMSLVVWRRLLCVLCFVFDLFTFCRLLVLVRYYYCDWEFLVCVCIVFCLFVLTFWW